MFDKVHGIKSTCFDKDYNFFKDIENMKQPEIKDCRGFSYDQNNRVIEPAFEYPPIL